MKFEFDTEAIKTEQTFAGYFYMLTKIGENLLQQVPSETLRDLVLSLKTVKRNYIAAIHTEKNEEVKEDTTHHTRERYYGQYLRSVTLPYPVKEDKITATLDNGVLELRLPKAEEVVAKRIEVKAQLPKPEPKKRLRKPKQKKS